MNILRSRLPLPRGTRSAATAVVLAIAAVVATACGVPLDDSARTIRTTTTAATTTTSEVLGSGHEVTIYFVKEDALVPQVVLSEDQPDVTAAVEHLLSATSPSGLSTAVPADTSLLGLEIDGERASVDLSSEMTGVSLELERMAYAQIVFTIFEFPSVTEVTFSIDGSPVDPPTDDGNKEVITAGDYTVLESQD